MILVDSFLGVKKDWEDLVGVFIDSLLIIDFLAEMLFLILIVLVLEVLV